VLSVFCKSSLFGSVPTPQTTNKKSAITATSYRCNPYRSLRFILTRDRILYLVGAKDVYSITRFYDGLGAVRK